MSRGVIKKVMTSQGAGSKLLRDPNFIRTPQLIIRRQGPNVFLARLIHNVAAYTFFKF